MDRLARLLVRLLKIRLAHPANVRLARATWRFATGDSEVVDTVPAPVRKASTFKVCQKTVDRLTGNRDLPATCFAVSPCGDSLNG